MDLRPTQGDENRRLWTEWGSCELKPAAAAADIGGTVVSARSAVGTGTTEAAAELPKMYGPFYRLDANGPAIAESGTLLGTPARNTYASDTAAAKAYVGELPSGKVGIEFYTPVQPSSVGSGTQGATAWWSGPPHSDVTSIPISPSKVVPPQQ